MSYIIGVDTGGTFTDTLVMTDDGRFITGKAPTTPDDLVVGLLAAVENAAEQLNVGLQEMIGDTTLFRYSGTTAINALITRSGVKAGMITTRGFEDVIHIARAMSVWAGLTEEQARNAYAQRKPPSVIPKQLIRGVAERTDSTGAEVVALDLAAVRNAADALVEQGVQSLAICFLWSVRNPEHELAARDAVLADHPDLFVTTSHNVAPTIGEYERFVTAAINAYVGPRLSAFLAGFETRLREYGFDGRLMISQSDGGSLSFEQTRPVYTLQSGPVAGVLASKTEGQLLDEPNIVTTDVGGTSFDVGLVADGDWVNAREPIVDAFHVGFPMVEVESIGAGGGSIAWVDDGGALNVGPQSAGANPGPACYGKGGTQPTVTDAALVLGYLNPANFLGGRMGLDVGLAEAAIESVGEAISTDMVTTAAGIFAIANTHMSSLVVRRVLARGYDPRDFVLFSYGGAGPVHSGFYADELGVKKVVVPALAGTFSSMGVASGPLHRSARLTDFAAMPMSPDELNERFDRLRNDVVQALEADGIPEESRRLVYALDMRYGVQVHTVKLRLPAEPFDEASVEAAGVAFDELYERLYGKGSGFVQAGRFVTSFIVEGFGDLPIPDRAPAERRNGVSIDDALVGERPAYFDGKYVSTGAFDFSRLRANDEVAGPAIIEGPTTTVVVPPAQRARIDDFRNIHLERATSPAQKG